LIPKMASGSKLAKSQKFYTLGVWIRPTLPHVKVPANPS